MFPSYIDVICHSNNPKTWLFIVERNWSEHSNRLNYADKIMKMQAKISPKDRVIFTCHKADLHPALFDATIPNKKQFFKDIKNQYPGIFSKYENKNPLTKFGKPYNFKFVVFSAGTFNELSDDKVRYNESNDKYPAELWSAILETVRGGW